MAVRAILQFPGLFWLPFTLSLQSTHIGVARQRSLPQISHFRHWSSSTEQPTTPPNARSAVPGFTTPPMQVFIEDTDAYGIMYNGNYLRAYDRALHMSTTTAAKENPINGNFVTSQHEGWSIVSLGKQKFISSPTLGNSFVIEGTLKEELTNEDCELWDMKMTSPDGATTYNTITDLHIAKPCSGEDNSNIFRLQPMESFVLDDSGNGINCASFIVYRDEIDAHWQGHLPLRNVLNLFERHRSIMLGGPEVLNRLQKEDGILAVVASIRDCCLIDEGVVCYPGQKVCVETTFVVKRKGMIVDFYQTLKSSTDDLRLAQGVVTLMMINAETGRPTSKLPTDLVRRFLELT